ncbi:hypothetical protein [Nocardioides nitrophenolicus]|uniref:hypothetical protein n=1 Tax=Nocardioides nitrophenolicus TaxID=60489 RepID=UPI00195BEF86|nr:hypothetical protein [Nocardioides nitrophenolicus]MBM7515772.1 hypothetical protein [Nocardioides nitrophenolicus]
MIPLHLGALHPVEQIATIVLAFGPFVVLGIVIMVRRRAEADEDLDEADEHGVEPRRREEH